jgi:chemotaxis signal transduction protein
MIPGDARQGIRLGLMSTGSLTIGLDVTCVAEVCTVRGISRLMTAAPGLIGAIELRGHPIPLFDPLQLAGLDPQPSEPRIAVVATREGRRVALGFDAIAGLVAVPRDRIERHDASEGAFFVGMFEADGQIVSLVEPRALLSRPDLPAAAVVAAGTRGAGAAAEAYLTFDAGGARFGIAATGVEATVPRQRIEPETLANGVWLGNIRHHGRRVPVIHVNAILGLGHVADLSTAEIVIVRFPEKRLVGLAVETIRRMQLVSRDAARALPPVLASGTLGLDRVVSDAEGRDTFLVDLAALRQDATLAGMAALSDDETPQFAGPPGALPPHAARAERARYLVARAGAALAIPIRQVARILMPPSEVTPLARAPGWFMGVFHMDGSTIPLIDLGDRLGHGPTRATDRARVLLGGSREHPAGFLVDAVDHLEWSAWRSDRAVRDDMVEGVVTVPRLGRQSVVPVVDLGRAAPAPDVHG